jgi:hypothetical protein
MRNVRSGSYQNYHNGVVTNQLTKMEEEGECVCVCVFLGGRGMAENLLICDRLGAMCTVHTIVQKSLQKT